MTNIVLTILLLTGHAFAQTPTDDMCSREAGSITAAQPMPIEHIIVIMQENHSFDNYLGHLNDPKYYGSDIDGTPTHFSNLGKKGDVVEAYHQGELCAVDPLHSWDAEHLKWNNGLNDGFVTSDSNYTMSYFNDDDIPFYYDLANHFAVGDRYFSSLLGPTLPNRFFLYTGTAFGHVKNDLLAESAWTRKTIWDVLNEHHVSWKYYTDGFGYLPFFTRVYLGNLSRRGFISNWRKDLKNNTLPEVVFIDGTMQTDDEHPGDNIQVGAYFVEQRVRELMASPEWKSSVLFITYDENGGLADHVPPPPACEPDDIKPHLKRGNIPGNYDRLGFRVPMIAVSPYVKQHYVSHTVYDHTSILKFIETKHGLPALTRRDANAADMLDLFDFDHPNFDVPDLRTGVPDPSRACRKLKPEPTPPHPKDV